MALASRSARYPQPSRMMRTTGFGRGIRPSQISDMSGRVKTETAQEIAGARRALVRGWWYHNPMVNNMPDGPPTECHVPGDKTLFTLGHSDLDFDQFVELLLKCRVQLLADV